MFIKHVRSEFFDQYTENTCKKNMKEVYSFINNIMGIFDYS